MTDPTRQTISASNGSVVIVPLSYANDCDGGIRADESSVVIVWDDDGDYISSVQGAIDKALENQANRTPFKIWSPPPQDQT